MQLIDKEDLEYLPSSERRRIEQMEKDLQAGEKPADADQVKPEEKPEEKPLETPSEEIIGVKPDEEQLEAEKAKPSETPQKDSETDWKYWKHRFDVVQGMLEAQKPLSQQVAALSQELATLKAEKEQAKIADEKPPEIVLDPAAYSGYGEDIEKLVGKFNEVVAELKELKGSNQTLAQRQARTAEERFFDSLDGAVPDWEVLQKTPEFSTWANKRHPGTPYTRSQFIQSYRNNLQADLIADIFKLYKAESGITDEPEQQKQPDPSKKSALEKQIVPDKGKGGAPPDSTPAPKVTAAQYKAAGEAFVRGRMTQAEFDKIDAAYMKSVGLVK
jgi:hypothetical protein